MTDLQTQLDLANLDYESFRNHHKSVMGFNPLNWPTSQVAMDRAMKSLDDLQAYEEEGERQVEAARLAKIRARNQQRHDLATSWFSRALESASAL